MEIAFRIHNRAKDLFSSPRFDLELTLLEIDYRFEDSKMKIEGNVIFENARIRISHTQFIAGAAKMAPHGYL